MSSTPDRSARRNDLLHTTPRIQRSSVPLVRAGSLSLFFAFLHDLGSPVERMLASAHLSPDAPLHPEELVPLRRVSHFTEDAARREGIEFLGLLAGGQARLDDLGTFGRLVQQSETLYQAIRKVHATVTMYSSGTHMWLSRRGHLAMFAHTSVLRGQSGYQLALISLMLMIELVRSSAPPGWTPNEVVLRDIGAHRRAFFQEFFRTDVRFERDVCAVCFDPLLLSAPLRTASADSLNALDRSLKHTAPADGFVDSIRQSIAYALKTRNAGVGAVARDAGVSTRTLERRLEKEGTSFSRLLDESRFRMAADLLQSSTLPIIEISLETGYDDQSNFARAFRRWAGISPSMFRAGAI